MRIERIWAGNVGRNFHYLIACEHTGEALAIDPLNWRACLERARTLGWSIRQIFNTHEHADHTGGNDELAAATGAPVLAPRAAAARIGQVTHALAGGDVVRVGNTVELECLDTPGHTLAHLCLYDRAQQPVLFCGDTLFNAGAGNCLHGGDPELLYETFTRRLARLPDDTLIYPGHEYLARNLAFCLSREPTNAAARALLERCAALAPEQAPVTTLGEERQINVFMRLGQPEIIGGLAALYGEPARRFSEREVFLKLRELRNRW